MSAAGNALLTAFAVFLIAAALSTDIADQARAFSLAAMFTVLALADLCVYWFLFRRS